MINNPFGTEAFCTVIVLFHPDDAAIGHLADLARWGFRPIVVVNAADPLLETRLATLPVAGLILNASNLGLAFALNQGIAAALKRGADYVMLLDQDSRVNANLGRDLMEAAIVAQGEDGALGCIGPVPIDRKRPTAATTLRDRAMPGAVTLPVYTVITSGMIIPRHAIERVGGMWNELFIDHIDHEWCFRARARNLSVRLALNVTLEHDIGDAGFSFLGTYKPIHRSPVRHYHIVRNTLWLARRSFIPRRWRVREVLKLLVRVPAYLVFSTNRAATLRGVAQATSAGLRAPPTGTYTS